MQEYKQKWTYKDLSWYLGRSESSLRHDVQHKKIPYIKIGRQVRFDPEAIISWEKTKEVPARA